MRGPWTHFAIVLTLFTALGISTAVTARDREPG